MIANCMRDMFFQCNTRCRAILKMSSIYFGHGNTDAKQGKKLFDKIGFRQNKEISPKGAMDEFVDGIRLYVGR